MPSLNIQAMLSQPCFDSLAEEGKWLPDIKVCLLICLYLHLSCYSISTGCSISRAEVGNDCGGSWSFDRLNGIWMDRCESIDEANTTSADYY